MKKGDYNKKTLVKKFQCIYREGQIIDQMIRGVAGSLGYDVPGDNAVGNIRGESLLNSFYIN